MAETHRVKAGARYNAYLCTKYLIVSPLAVQLLFISQVGKAGRGLPQRSGPRYLFEYGLVWSLPLAASTN